MPTVEEPTEVDAIIIDAGVGNLGNLKRALESLGARATITRDPRVVGEGRCLLLPGVGAFRPPREALRGAMEEAIRGALDGGAHLLGICIGFQLLFDSSSEFGATDGLGLLSGDVAPLPETVELPHMGWNRLHDLTAHPLLSGIDPGSYFLLRPQLRSHGCSGRGISRVLHPWPSVCRDLWIGRRLRYAVPP